MYVQSIFKQAGTSLPVIFFIFVIDYKSKSVIEYLTGSKENYSSQRYYRKVKMWRSITEIWG